MATLPLVLVVVGSSDLRDWTKSGMNLAVRAMMDEELCGASVLAPCLMRTNTGYMPDPVKVRELEAQAIRRKFPDEVRFVGTFNEADMIGIVALAKQYGYGDVPAELVSAA